MNDSYAKRAGDRENIGPAPAETRLRLSPVEAILTEDHEWIVHDEYGVPERFAYLDMGCAKRTADTVNKRIARYRREAMEQTAQLIEIAEEARQRVSEAGRKAREQKETDVLKALHAALWERHQDDLQRTQLIIKLISDARSAGMSIHSVLVQVQAWRPVPKDTP